MAWHSVSQAQNMTGKSRRTLYRDMASGRLSWRTNASGHRELETSELIRVYGEIKKDGTAERHIVAQPDDTVPSRVMMDELRALRQEVADLKSMLLRLEHKPEKPPEVAAPWWRFWQKKST
ncbi:entry exclusion protein 1 [Salmonella enterica subsp. enterica serovar Typhimurium]|nr:entry exclusion protein 1 [Salmonella enterica subsp. enterica serovar Typhimurium]